ncbi:MAG: helix-turn-helix transcriptional regulator [Lentihominibacter sp.]
MRNYLKELRTERGLTQTQVADNLGISQNYYSNIENGVAMKVMDLLLLDSISNLYHVSLNGLVQQELELLRKEA